MYADDIALVAETHEALQEALTITDRVFIHWGMREYKKDPIPPFLHNGAQTIDRSEQFCLRGQPQEQVQMFKNLGSF